MPHDTDPIRADAASGNVLFKGRQANDRAEDQAAFRSGGLLALGQQFHRYALSQVRPSSWVGRPHKYSCRRGQRMRGSAADRARLSPARNPSAGAATRGCSRWTTRSPPGWVRLHCQCGWSGPRGLPARSLRARAADQGRRIPGGGQAACGNRTGGRIRLRARRRREGAPGTSTRRAGQEGSQKRLHIVRPGCSSRLAAMHYPASARRQHSPSRGLSPAGLRTRGSAGIISRT